MGNGVFKYILALIGCSLMPREGPTCICMHIHAYACICKHDACMLHAYCMHLHAYCMHTACICVHMHAYCSITNLCGDHCQSSGSCAGVACNRGYHPRVFLG